MNIRVQYRGFTVLEFLVVVTVITILMAVVLAGLSFSREKTRDNIRIAEMQTVALALEQYRSVCREYPGSADLDASNGCPVDQDINLGSFLSEIPSSFIDTEEPQIKYVALTSALGQTSSVQKCTHYLLRIVLEDEERKELADDSDFGIDPQGNIRNDYGGYDQCASSNVFTASDFSTIDPIYDIFR